MTMEIKLHPAQSSVLFTLRHATSARYSELQRTTTLESDVFKFHLRKLQTYGYVMKMDSGAYELTAEGKEFANRHDEKTGRMIAQPKSSMLIVVTTVSNGQTYYLAHRRSREPFRNFWGIGSGPVIRGVPIYEQATTELKKQTGIDADLNVCGMYRVISTAPNGDVREDTLFAVVCAEVSSKITPHEWIGGKSSWMTKEELLGQTKLFSNTQGLFEMLEQGDIFRENSYVYNNDEY